MEQKMFEMCENLKELRKLYKRQYFFSHDLRKKILFKQNRIITGETIEERTNKIRDKLHEILYPDEFIERDGRFYLTSSQYI